MDSRFLKIIKITACGAAAFTLFSLGVMLLWNWLIPEIFSGPSITFVQALGILVLSKILFTGVGGRCNCQNGGKRQFWRQKFYEKMQRMSPEDRERFKSKFGKCFEENEAIHPNNKEMNRS